MVVQISIHVHSIFIVCSSRFLCICPKVSKLWVAIQYDKRICLGLEAIHKIYNLRTEPVLINET
jgi:hypothetical protein